MINVYLERHFFLLFQMQTACSEGPQSRHRNSFRQSFPQVAQIGSVGQNRLLNQTGRSTEPVEWIGLRRLLFISFRSCVCQVFQVIYSAFELPFSK